MTAPLFLRRRVATPRRRILSVTDTWKITPEGHLRRVIVREPDGTVTARLLSDDHPALVRYLDRAAVAA